MHKKVIISRYDFLLTEAHKKNFALRKALERYSNHDDDCAWVLAGLKFSECSCGLSKALEENK